MNRKSSTLLITILGTNFLVKPAHAENIIDKVEVFYEVKKWSKQFGQDSALIMSQIQIESDFDASCQSEADAKCLMQIVPKTAVWMLRDMKKKGIIQKDVIYEPWDWQQNIMVGTYHMKWLQDYYGAKFKVIDKTNAGLSSYWMGTTGFENYFSKSGTSSTSYSRSVNALVPKYRNWIAEQTTSRGGERKEEWKSKELHLNQQSTQSLVGPTLIGVEKDLSQSYIMEKYGPGLPLTVATPVKKEELTQTDIPTNVLIGVSHVFVIIGCALMVTSITLLIMKWFNRIRK